VPSLIHAWVLAAALWAVVAALAAAERGLSPRVIQPLEA
jgi:hypothetical protein